MTVCMVRWACATLRIEGGKARRGHVGAGWTGAHALRHTAATRLLRAGASLKEIAEILGHRSIDTTAIYAKVDDVERLAGVALPWP